LHGLDKAIAHIDPKSKRIYMMLPPAQMDGVAPSQRESVAISEVVSALEKMPERLEWDRIVIATPAYAALDRDRMADKLQGFGLFLQPLCQAIRVHASTTSIRQAGPMPSRRKTSPSRPIAFSHRSPT